MCEIYNITCIFFLKKNPLRNSTADIFIIRGEIIREKSQALYDAKLPGMNVLRYVTHTHTMYLSKICARTLIY